ncbi:MAG: hypothetical protein ACRDP9_25885 [Kribbellaceae bacterium]
MLTPEQRTLRARIAANTRWAGDEDRKAHGDRAQRGLRARFEREVDPDGTLPEKERKRRAESLYKAHMARLALKSSKARAARKAGDADAGAA